MKIRLNTARVGPGVDNAPGDVIEVPAAEGRRLIATGQATPPRARPIERAATPRGESEDRCF